MFLYKVNIDNNFLSYVVKFIIRDNKSLVDLDIVVPNTVFAKSLQDEFVRNINQASTILPKIIPLQKLDVVNQSLILMDDFEFITEVQNKIIIADILSNIKKISFVEALSVTPYVLKILNKLIKFENCDVDFNFFPQISESSKFIIKILQSWRQKLVQVNKKHSILHLQQKLPQLIQLVKGERYSRKLIFVGILDKFLHSLLIEILKNSHVVILPPHQDFYDKNSLIGEFLFNYQIDVKKIKNLSNIIKVPYPTIRNDFGVNYFECDNEMLEYDKVISLINNILFNEEKNSVVVITSNQRKIDLISNIFSNKVKIENRVFFNVLGDFVLQIAKFFSSEVFVKDFIILLKHSCIDSFSAIEGEVFDFEMLIARKNLYFLDIFELEKKIKHPYLLRVFNIIKLIISFRSKNEKLSLSQISKMHFSVFNRLVCKNKISQSLMFGVMQNIQDIFVNLNESNNIVKCDDYIKIFRSLIKPNFFCSIRNKHEKIIKIISSEEVMLLSDLFQDIIITDFVEDVWPKVDSVNPFLTKNIVKKLGFEKNRQELYDTYFKYLKENYNLFILASKFYSGKSSKKSRYIYGLNFDDAKNTYESVKFYTQGSGLKFKNFKKDIFTQEKILFPDKISSTQIDLLMRNPYFYYAKKILSLDYLDFFKESANKADFGIFIHKVIDSYTKSRVKSVKNFIDVSNKVFNGQVYKKEIVWLELIKNFAEEFVRLDDKRNQGLRSILSETYHQSKIEVERKEIILFSIMDKVEELTSGELNIVDYKTGFVPTVKDVLSRKYCQLITSALILSKKGSKLSDLVKNLVYIKLNNRSPYFTTVVIPVNLNLLKEHYHSLKVLLEFFSSTENYPAFKTNWGEYLHLARL